MSDKLNDKTFEQLSIADILNMSNDAGNILSSKELDDAIGKLQKLQAQVKSREEAEKKEREREERRRKELEEKEKKDAHIREVTCMDLPLSWENVFNTDVRAQGVHTESVSDALVLSLNTLGKVDIEYISSITGISYKEVIGSLRGSIYQNPQTWGECFYKGWETADEYLSGNLMRKWQAANAANIKYKGYFFDNLKAIEAVLPPTVSTKDIYVTLGSPWVPADIIDDFISHLFEGNCRAFWRFDFDVRHDEITGTWEIPYKTRYGHCVTDTKTYGTDRIEALYILERTLNMKSVAVTDEVQCLTNKSGKKRVINKDETVLAIEKQQKMIAEFQKWVWEDENRKERLETIFENKFSCVRHRIFDGSFLDFPTMSPDIQLYPYQKNAVARILFSPNTLLAHDVGSGKTYVMIAAGMELRRMGLSKKNLYVVPNNIIGQWQDIFRTMYPSAKLLTVEPKSFTPTKRKKMLEKIRDEEFDGIIMAYSCFEQIPISQHFFINQLKDTQELIEETAYDFRKNTKKLQKQNEKITKQLAELTATLNVLSNDVYFDELGITRLFVDEAHNYKNVPIETKTDKVLGVKSDGSKKCADMLDKVRTVQKNGGGVVMATGTPITNSITDAFIMQKYLQNGELALLDMQNFDSWVGMFAEQVTEFEIDVDTQSYRLATRFSKFHNLPELTSLFSQIADFHQLDKNNGIPDFDGYSDSLIAKTTEFADYLNDISDRADAVRHGYVPRTIDNMLKITTDGRKAALDLRLVSPSAVFTYQSKVARCAENVFNIYQRTAGTQLIFCDTSTPKASFNIYDEMRQLLTRLGIPNEKIAYVHDATSEIKRNQLFDMVRKGVIRVLIGSTFKLGLGVNVQDKLIAVHHLDVPWRPADMTQREGRILRQGNENKNVEIFRYITEGSFDAYSWQLLETKQRFITGLLSGSYTERDGGDIEDTVLNYAEVKALAVGNPLIKKRVETANELSRYLTLQRKLVETRLCLEKELRELPAQIARQKVLIENARKDKEFYDELIRSLPVPVTTAEKQAEASQRKSIREMIFAAVQNNELKTAETKLTVYHGFQITLPANMKKEKPFVWLQRTGRYYVELGDTEIGGLIRIDNFLDNLDAHIEKLSGRLADMQNRGAHIQSELEIKESYTEKIEELKAEIGKIDKKLGVDKK
ncbi:MAG: DEAD/DEAH box helicase family protein [Oscillospiraceae bacterium]|nr:DEAD/DEAH box helicase family protein [Oscillospiraceae bacterium]